MTLDRTSVSLHFSKRKAFWSQVAIQIFQKLLCWKRPLCSVLKGIDHGYIPSTLARRDGIN